MRYPSIHCCRMRKKNFLCNEIEKSFLSDAAGHASLSFFCLFGKVLRSFLVPPPPTPW